MGRFMAFYPVMGCRSRANDNSRQVQTCFAELHRLPTGEQVTGDLAKNVVLLHLKLSIGKDERNCHEN